jgi:hypothetical protein
MRNKVEVKTYKGSDRIVKSIYHNNNFCGGVFAEISYNENNSGIAKLFYMSGNNKRFFGELPYLGEFIDNQIEGVLESIIEGFEVVLDEKVKMYIKEGWSHG